MNISSAIVHARPGHAEVVQRALAAIDGVEVHATSADGKVIVTIESPSDQETADTFAAIGRLDHVMSSSMVYHQTESDPDGEMAGTANMPKLPGDMK